MRLALEEWQTRQHSAGRLIRADNDAIADAAY